MYLSIFYNDLFRRLIFIYFSFLRQGSNQWHLHIPFSKDHSLVDAVLLACTLVVLLNLINKAPYSLVSVKNASSVFYKNLIIQSKNNFLFNFSCSMGQMSIKRNGTCILIIIAHPSCFDPYDVKFYLPIILVQNELFCKYDVSSVSEIFCSEFNNYEGIYALSADTTAAYQKNDSSISTQQ